ncbi:MAG: hypothetical protein HY717_01635 [Planctomycetes bacterium]|nr:hypothetical protein [Planctomycetota bacterium]
MNGVQAEVKRCQALKRDGAPCGVRAGPLGLCIFHSPESAEWRKRGGERSLLATRLHLRLPPALKWVADVLAESIRQTKDGRLEPNAAAAIAKLAAVLLQLHVAAKELVLDGDKLEKLPTTEVSEREEIAKTVIEEMRRAKTT